MSGKFSLKIVQGDTFSEVFWWTDELGVAINLAGWIARMQIRKTVADATVLLELTTENGGIVITPETGKIEIKIDSEATSLLTWNTGVYDLEMVQAGSPPFIKKLLYGNVIVVKEVTR